MSSLFTICTPGGVVRQCEAWTEGGRRDHRGVVRCRRRGQRVGSWSQRVGGVAILSLDHSARLMKLHEPLKPGGGAVCPRSFKSLSVVSYRQYCHLVESKREAPP